jgi:hypothetical protein
LVSFHGVPASVATAQEAGQMSNSGAPRTPSETEKCHPIGHDHAESQ